MKTNSLSIFTNMMICILPCMEYCYEFGRATFKVLAAYFPSTRNIQSDDDADCFYQAVLYGIRKYEDDNIASLAKALKFSTVWNLLQTGRITEAECVEYLKPTSYATNEHYLQVAKDLGVCIWFISMADKQVAVYNRSEDRSNRVYVGWHDGHVQPFYFGVTPNLETLELDGWEVDVVQAWFPLSSCIGRKARTPRVLFDSLVARTGLSCSLDIRANAAYMRCKDCRSTLATIRRTGKHSDGSVQWELYKVSLDHKYDCSDYSPIHCTIDHK
ncbi:hypothetical protein ADUPG1_011960 [Aduncisulcus paluster]|uniref:OTU domain-containing protein n=1 Tax=Aduncisulcus paluster TaxID=2918883 RepID=A0ABQ5JXR7_9EUKA|nr:hypothetical protein ADUPG1_011960 [Aduncisulcus paluster]